jgi:peptidoglycan/LPS O-acetylase OafA/YrhL
VPISGAFMADTFFGKFGVYSVSIFYILSGLTLYHVYYNKMKPTWKDIQSFFIRRIFRIYPLFWVVTVIAIYLSGNTPTAYDLTLNLTGLFAFVKWDLYFSPGIWSIGNELVFYCFFILFVFLTKRNRSLMILLSSILLGLFLYFAFEKIPRSMGAGAWKNYVNPLNQVFLFLGGYFIGLFLENKSIKNIYLVLILLFSIIVFCFYQEGGDIVNNMIGFARLIYSACCFMICLVFYKISVKPPRLIHNTLKLLGEMSYSIYLLHPIIWILMGRIGVYYCYFSEPVRLVSSVIVTLIMSYFVYKYFEKYFMKRARYYTAAENF